ncbi:hypothetical protein CVT26_006093 [Gymnopilus dilepis]|uniref:Uncharacterized protein n=1 Tax=Gymnopilus dilepis TaxID=231916 RepID=A0A409WBV6_9AGAR|nr:hypothetical protein CVT26_006093 [Gymnopilus dilepis]
MDPISAAITVCSLCNRILDWIKKLGEKESLLKEISFTVVQVRNLIQPFTLGTLKRDGTREHQLSVSIQSVGAVLRTIEEHVRIYESRKTQRILAFLSPGAVIQKLKDDQDQLNHQLVILLASIATVGYFRDHEKDKELVNVPPSEELGDGPPTALDQLLAQDAREFWKDYIGAKIEVVDIHIFSSRLASWYGENLSAESRRVILMRLDEFDSGVVTPQNLGKVVQKGSLRAFVETYKASNKQPGRISTGPFTWAPDDDSQLRLPLLVWIDDRPDNNSAEVNFAQTMGIQVIQLLSTAEAKLWVDENLDFLRKYDHPSNIRFISDNVRLEAASSSSPDGERFLNASAGQNLLHFLRGRLISAPFLIYTYTTINWTRFVLDYEAAGSTIYVAICMTYISQLAARRADGDDEWRGFNVDFAI